MDFDPVFFIALQSSLVLGLIHGINPCGHSWLVIAPFVVGHGSGRRAFVLTSSFLAGTAAACLAIGLTLGTVSMAIPESAVRAVGLVTGAVVVVLGVILMLKPSLLHSHDHDHEHTHDHHHAHGHDHGHSCAAHASRARPKAASVAGLFAVGFVNMIVPCPTVAVMYSYAIDSGSWQKATLVFAAYALTTAVAVGGVILLLRRTAGLVKRLEKPWLESAIMRTAGALTIGFGVYSILLEIGPANA